jgi:hypothetical protein
MAHLTRKNQGNGTRGLGILLLLKFDQGFDFIQLVRGCERRVNLVTIHYRQSISHKIIHGSKLIAYEIIETSLQS